MVKSRLLLGLGLTVKKSNMKYERIQEYNGDSSLRFTVRITMGI